MAPQPRALTSDVVIVGCGVAGLYSALNLPRGLRVTMICKEDLESCDSMLAQGGICVMRDPTTTTPGSTTPCAPVTASAARRAWTP